MKSAFFRDFTQRSQFVTDVSGKPIGSIFVGRAGIWQLDPWKWDR